MMLQNFLLSTPSDAYEQNLYRLKKETILKIKQDSLAIKKGEKVPAKQKKPHLELSSSQIISSHNANVDQEVHRQLSLEGV